ncbi:GNAT family N-acetyltransferase [Litoribacter alkaliphilus]|uniref:GNAT family N-acetyltransferase n=1 Tax=Litoribacter ruber TaxID=702568 RepID=A0AAP2CF55_9BACT|nr:GNAT family N-acetyltransferase [Litoribacter alkaliphilus]MBS9522535.1 GNAT family N-acetyltransferase [Litoribacter alkaliphilus]
MKGVEIITFRPQLASYFTSINKEWVEQYFSLEPFDIAQLEDPQGYIIDRGGEVLFAEVSNKVVGTVALVKTDEDRVYEIIKMGVLPASQGKGVGLALLGAIIQKAKEKGVRKVILYSSSKLQSALRLYKKAGFVEVEKECGKYERCDVKMEVLII